METDDWRVVGVLGVCVVLAAVAVFWNEAHALLQNGADLPAWVQAFAAVVSACLTVALVWTTRKQAEIAEAQRVVMAGQLVSAQRTVEAMKDSAEHQLRAYVSVAGATMTGDPAFGVIRLENFGQTPAYDVRIWAGIWVGRHPLREDPPSPPPSFQTASHTIGPRSWVNMQTPPLPPQRPEVMAMLGTPAAAVFFYGRVTYRDIFDIERTSNFRFVHNSREDAGRLCPDLGGNECS